MWANPTVRGIHQCSKQSFQPHHPGVSETPPPRFFFFFGFHHPLQLLQLFLRNIVVLLRLQSNLVGDFRLILHGFCVILRGFCAMLGLLEHHHRVQHIWGMYRTAAWASAEVLLVRASAYLPCFSCSRFSSSCKQVCSVGCLFET